MQNKTNEDQVTTTEYFGGCPLCGKNNGYLNIGRNHFFYCDLHQTKWRIGSNLFSSWHAETEADWKKNHLQLYDYREVEPVYPVDQTLGQLMDSPEGV